MVVSVLVFAIELRGAVMYIRRQLRPIFVGGQHFNVANLASLEPISRHKDIHRVSIPLAWQRCRWLVLHPPYQCLLGPKFEVVSSHLQ